MSEIFDGACERLARVVKDELDVDVHATISFTYADVRAALAWGKKHRYSYERDGELGGLLFAAMVAGVVQPERDVSEETDVDVQG